MKTIPTILLLTATISMIILLLSGAPCIEAAGRNDPTSAAGPDEATTVPPIRGINGLVFSVPCAVTQYIPYPCSSPSNADPQITDFCQCTVG